MSVQGAVAGATSSGSEGRALGEMREEMAGRVGRPRRRLRANACRDYLRERTEDAWKAIVQSLVDEAKAGSVPHITLLARLAGFEQRPAAPSMPERRGKSFARQLREQMEELHARNTAEFGE